MNVLDFDINITITDAGELDQVLISYGEESTLLRRDEVFAHARTGDLLCKIIVERLADLKLQGRLTMEVPRREGDFQVVAYGGGGGGANGTTSTAGMTTSFAVGPSGQGGRGGVAITKGPSK